MNDDQLDGLFSKARAAKPDTSCAEYGFETRLMTRLHADREQAAPWFVFAWRLIPVFATIVIALGAWNYSVSNATSADLRTALADDSDESTLVSYFTGETQ
jgi:hypothetical protein